MAFRALYSTLVIKIVFAGSGDWMGIQSCFGLSGLFEELEHFFPNLEKTEKILEKKLNIEKSWKIRQLSKNFSNYSGKFFFPESCS